MLSEISQTKANTVEYHLYGESKKHYKPANITNRRKITDKEKKLAVSIVGLWKRGIPVHCWFSHYGKKEGRRKGQHRGRGLKGTNY